MALKTLSTAVMVHVSDFARPGTPERAALESVPEARALIPLCESALEKLLLAQPPNESTIDKITSDLAAEDVRHDDLVRGIFARLDSEAALSVDPEVRQACFTARNALFPGGVSIVNRSYTQEAGEAPLREKRVTPDVERTLKKLKTHDGTTLWAHYEELQGRALTIGVQEKRRTGLEVEGTEVPRTVDARNGWIRAVNALANVLAAAEVDEAPILGGVRIAEARAEASRGGGGGGAAPGGGSQSGGSAGGGSAGGGGGPSGPANPAGGNAPAS